MSLRIIMAALALLMSFAGHLSAQFSGHWEGVIRLPANTAAVQIDIMQDGKGEWSGVVRIPSQGSEAIPFTRVTIKRNGVRLASGNPENLVFEGSLSSDGLMIAGNAAQDGVPVPFELRRKGDARVQDAARSTSVSKELEGKWHGELKTHGSISHLALTLTNRDGSATGVIFSSEHGGEELPITLITQDGASLKIEFGTIRAVYRATLKGRQLTGQWEQNGAILPLEFAREGNRP